jgi:DNA-binding transcriptional MocR family regulator
MLKIGGAGKQGQAPAICCVADAFARICYGPETGLLYLLPTASNGDHRVMDQPAQLLPPLPTLYGRLAAHYRDAIVAGSLARGDRLPSLRALMRQHEVSLSTALQFCRQLESEGWLEARPRSGYFVRGNPLRQRLATTPLDEPQIARAPDPAQYVGIHAQVSEFIAQGRQNTVRVNLSCSRCAPELYPAEALKNATIRALRRRPDVLVGVSPHNGDPAFRAVLAKRALENGLILAPDDVLVTQGCIEALNLALRAVAQPGDTIAVESPTFYGLLQILESLGMRALEIPTSPQTGVSIEAMELAIRSYDNIRALVVIPHLQNPLGSIMPDGHKERLVALCEANGIPLIEDATYGELVNSEAPLKALKAWDRSGNVIRCSSLHKSLAPGLRLGWITAGRWQARVEMLKYAQTRNNDELAQLAVGDYMASGAYDRHLRRLRQTVTQQRERTAEAIAAYFPPGTRLTVPNGGLALWVELPQQISSKAVFDAALREGILVAPGLMFSNSNRFDHYLRINCAWPYSAEIDGALRRLGEIVADRLDHAH